MALMHARIRLAATVGLALALSACTVHKTEVPALSGPSGLGNNISITVSPDVLKQDGVSQSLVTITALDSNGQPKPNVQLRADIAVAGSITDFGRLSAKSLVTDSTGKATVTFTAPPPPAVVVNGGTKVDIQVTPLDSNFDNTNPRVASIMLVPPGIVIAGSALVPDFVAPSPNAGDTATFTATFTDPTNSHLVPASFSWNFGDGTTASGQTVTHKFLTSGATIVTLTLTDNLGHTSSVTKTVTVGAPTTVTPVFFTTPAAPVSGQSIIFNASQTQPPPGHTITGVFWDFGDGSDGATGAVVSHTFASPGTYTVLLRVVLDNGAQATSSQTLTVAVPNPTARINVLPPTGTTSTTITFVGNQSTAAPGHQIVSYTWNFGDGGTGVGATVTHRYAATGTYTVSLIVTDEAGNQGIATASVTITP